MRGSKFLKTCLRRDEKIVHFSWGGWKIPFQIIQISTFLMRGVNIFSFFAQGGSKKIPSSERGVQNFCHVNLNSTTPLLLGHKWPTPNLLFTYAFTKTNKDVARLPGLQHSAWGSRISLWPPTRFRTGNLLRNQLSPAWLLHSKLIKYESEFVKKFKYCNALNKRSGAKTSEDRHPIRRAPL